MRRSLVLYATCQPPFSGDYRLLDSQKKSFWLLFTLLSLGAFFLPFWWGVAETFAAVFLSWWVIYRSGLF
jgi:hypothetical protein